MQNYIVNIPSPSAETFKESIKFGLVGGSGIIVNFIVLSIALYVFFIIEPIALALGIIVSMSSNYVFNRIWTFESDNDIGGEYVRYIMLNGLGILIQYVVALLLELYFDSIGLHSVQIIVFYIPTIFIASFIGILIGFLSNFMFSKYIVFSENVITGQSEA